MMNRVRAGSRVLSPLAARFDSPLARDCMAVAILVGLILLFVAPALAPGRVLMPLDIVTQWWPPWQQPGQAADVHNLMLSDVVNYIYPVKRFMAQALWSGEFPLWNPYVFTGYPFTYNTQAGVFYPLSLLYYLLPDVTAVDVTIILQMSLGAAFTFAYLRQMQLKRPAALVGATVFTFNGVMVAWLEWQVVHAAVIWLPAQLYLVEQLARKRAERRGIVREVVGIGILFAIPWLGGHWNWTLYTSLTLVVYMALRLGVTAGRARYLEKPAKAVTTNPSEQRWQRTRLLQPLKITVAALAIGVALSLVQVLPAYTYLSQTHRQALPFIGLLSQGLLNRAVVLLVPHFFGSSVSQKWWGPPQSNDVETAIYCSILALVLAGVAPLLRRDWPTRFFAAWGGLGLLWALGTPAYGLLYVLPAFNGLYPSRAAFLVTFSVSVLAALSVDRLLDPVQQWPRRLTRMTAAFISLLLLMVVAYGLIYRAGVVDQWPGLQRHLALFLLFLVGSAGVLLARLRGRLQAKPFAGLALLWIVSDLFIFGYGYNTVGSVTDLYPEVAVTDFLQGDPEIFRIATLAEGTVFYPNTSLVVEVPNISGYEPGILRRVVGFVAAAEGGDPVRFGRVLMPLAGADSPLLAMANVKYVVTLAERWASQAERGAAQEQVTTWLPLPAEQRFEMPDAGLQRLDLPLQVRGEPEGVVTVRVLPADGAHEFAHAEANAVDLQREGRHSFYFSPFPSEWGRTFLFRVEFSGTGGEVMLGSAGQAPAFVAYYLPRPQLVYEDGKTRVYLNEGYFPRAFTVPAGTVVGDEAAALAAVGEHADELDRRVFLELEEQPPPPDLGSPAAAGSVVTVNSYRLNQVELQAKMAAPGFVVLSDTYYPGWRATIDGQPTPVYRANALVRAVYVPAGEHSIRFIFRPPDFLAGAGISGATLLGCVALLWWDRKRQQKRMKDGQPQVA